MPCYRRLRSRADDRPDFFNTVNGDFSYNDELLNTISFSHWFNPSVDVVQTSGTNYFPWIGSYSNKPPGNHHVGNHGSSAYFNSSFDRSWTSSGYSSEDDGSDEPPYYRRHQEVFNFPVPKDAVQLLKYANSIVIKNQIFYCDNKNNFVQVYTDGAFMKGSQGRSFSAIGVFFGYQHHLNLSRMTERGGVRGSDSAEFEAIIEAIKIAKAYGVKKLQVNTDSQNAIRFMKYFVFKWERNGWRNVRGLPVRNQHLIRRLHYYSNSIDVKWNHLIFISISKDRVLKKDAR